MEYMKLNGFLGGAVSKLINKGIEAKFGYKPSIDIDSLNLRTIEKMELDMNTDKVIRDGDRIVLDLSVSMSQKDFDKLMEEVTK